MKNIKPIFYSFSLAVLLLLATAFSAKAQNNSNEKSAHIAEILHNQNFTFKAQTVTPMGGRLRQLTSDYDVQVTGDTLQAYLPYFGRAYSAPIGTSQGGIQFTDTAYQYNVKEGRKGGWEVTLVPTGEDVRQMVLNVSPSGYASLHVTSNNRQFISYNGVITERSRKRNKTF